MSAPTPITVPYIACVGQPGSVGGAAVAINAGGVMLNSATDDMTNNLGGGWEEAVATTLSGDVDITVAWKAPTQLLVGQVYPLLANVTSMPTFVAGTFTPPTPVNAGFPAFAGDFMVTSLSAVSFDVKAGFKQQIKGKTQGQCTYLT